jgi:Ca2+-dependent lipid-binding protein
MTIVAKEARNLPAVNLGGKSDPYLRFSLENQQFKTKVKKRNLNPKWEQEFEL